MQARQIELETKLCCMCTFSNSDWATVEVSFNGISFCICNHHLSETIDNLLTMQAKMQNISEL